MQNPSEQRRNIMAGQSEFRRQESVARCTTLRGPGQSDAGLGSRSRLYLYSENDTLGVDARLQPIDRIEAPYLIARTLPGSTPHWIDAAIEKAGPAAWAGLIHLPNADCAIGFHPQHKIHKQLPHRPLLLWDILPPDSLRNFSNFLQLQPT